MITEAIVLAGGMGTRLRQAVSEVPKSMAPVNGRPFLEYLLDYLDKNGFGHVVLSVGFMNEQIREHFGERHKGIRLSYAVEESPLGTGGGIRKAFGMVGGAEAFAFNGDSLFLADPAKMFSFHETGAGYLTIALRYVEDASRYGSVKMDALHRIRGFAEKTAEGGPGYINGGVYILNKAFLTGTAFPESFSLEKDCFEQYYRDIPILGFPSEGYFLDIGIPEDYHRAQDEFRKLEY